MSHTDDSVACSSFCSPSARYRWANRMVARELQMMLAARLDEETGFLAETSFGIRTRLAEFSSMSEFGPEPLRLAAAGAERDSGRCTQQRYNGENHESIFKR